MLRIYKKICINYGPTSLEIYNCKYLILKQQVSNWLELFDILIDSYSMRREKTQLLIQKFHHVNTCHSYIKKKFNAPETRQKHFYIFRVAETESDLRIVPSGHNFFLPLKEGAKIS